MKTLPVVLAMCLLTGCTHGKRSQSPQYVHVVVMWLKEPGNEQHRQQIINAGQSFVGRIPGLVSVRAGRVHPSSRPVVDSTYDVAFVMIFDDQEALRAYGPHPVHQQAVKEVITPLVERFAIYDFADDLQKQ